MSAKIAAFVVTLLINLIAGIVIFFAMLLAMNGYSENDATYGFAAYILLAAVVSILMAASAVFFVRVLLDRNRGGVISAILAIGIFSIIGVVLKVFCSIIGVGITEFVRTNY